MPIINTLLGARNLKLVLWYVLNIRIHYARNVFCKSERLWHCIELNIGRKLFVTRQYGRTGSKLSLRYRRETAIDGVLSGSTGGH
jgi:hypothetical protein